MLLLLLLRGGRRGRGVSHKEEFFVIFYEWVLSDRPAFFAFRPLVSPLLTTANVSRGVHL